MRLLIAYDGSGYAEAALEDLLRAGLPEQVEALVLSVADAYLPPVPQSEYEYASNKQAAGLSEWALRELKREEELALRARLRLQSLFPTWQVGSEARLGSPARNIIDRAEEWKAALIVLGARGHSALDRLVLGSVSQRVATEAHCSVRIARRSQQKGAHPLRLLIGVDGSPDSEAAVHTVATRLWPAQTEVRLITSIGPFYHLTGAAIEEEKKRARKLQEPLEDELLEAGLAVSTLISGEDPRRVIVSEAEEWKADSIFVGTKGLGRVGRFLLGSVSTAVVARAHCSVEIVRVEESRSTAPETA
jgi:nucleotide-binding universal stress UspA family protein